MVLHRAANAELVELPMIPCHVVAPEIAALATRDISEKTNYRFLADAIGINGGAQP